MEIYSSKPINTPEMDKMIAERRRYLADLSIADGIADIYVWDCESKDTDVNLDDVYRHLIWGGFSRRVAKEASIQWHVGMGVYENERQAGEAFAAMKADDFKHPTKKQVNAAARKFLRDTKPDRYPQAYKDRPEGDPK